MFTELHLINFKIWQNVRLSLKPITLLLGANSSGKSSLIQSLLLLRQTVKGEHSYQDLNFGVPESQDSVILGKFKDVVRKSSLNYLAIQFSWHTSDQPDVPLSFAARYLEYPKGQASLDYLRLGTEKEFFTIERANYNIYSLRVGHERKSRGKSEDFRPEKSYYLSDKALEQLGPDGKKIKQISQMLFNELTSLIYLGPVKRVAQRDYYWKGFMPQSIGDDGSNAIDILIASDKEAQRERRKFKEPSGDGLIVQEVAKWLKKMDLADDLHIKRLGRSERYEVLVTRNESTSNLKDVGVGVSQVLPVIVAALYAKPGHIVILEEPESHLHPLAQSLLAELFACIAKERNVQFIVETHSEHLFRRMQTLLANQTITQEDCRMYFVEREGKDAHLRELFTNEYGALTNWPEKFFGDALGETREQARLMFERQKQERQQS